MIEIPGSPFQADLPLGGIGTRHEAISRSAEANRTCEITMRGSSFQVGPPELDSRRECKRHCCENPGSHFPSDLPAGGIDKRYEGFLSPPTVHPPATLPRRKPLLCNGWACRRPVSSMTDLTPAEGSSIGHSRRPSIISSFPKDDSTAPKVR